MNIIYVKTIYKIEGDKIPSDFLIEVYKSDDVYYGEANYFFWGPNQAKPYKSVAFCSTIEEALDDAINGAIDFGLNTYAADLIFWEKNGKYIDGNGKKVSFDYIKDKFDNYNKNIDG